jgi:putative CocE/NonD family hydrolase
MTIRTDFPHDIVVRDNVRIPMRDGATLSARVWLPADAEANPVPALVEYLPYRKNDWTAVRDSQRHPWYAGHGYASIRIDMRGCGDSDGVLYDEYLPQEQDDAEDALAWIAAQSWCVGDTGMFGISWGGFNSLQLAARRPPSLRAIVTVCSSDDRYADDVHYWGGNVLGIDMASWAASMLAFGCRPPDPATVGETWRRMWQERLTKPRPFIETWLAHQERDGYWRQGSVCEDYAAIDIPVFAVGGWHDPYRDTVFRLLANLPGPALGLVGPWAHKYPDIATVPGPAIGFLQETLRWWDHWLKKRDTGIMHEPKLRAFVQEWVPPRPAHGDLPGRWVGEPSWPSPHVTTSDWWLTRQGLSREPEPGALSRTVRSPLHTGVDAGRFFPFGNAADLPADQRAEDGRCECFDTDELAEPVRILGIPQAELDLDCDRPAGQVIVRLCDVAPDGSSTLVTRGSLNLTHRHGHDTAVAWRSGMPERVVLPMAAAGYVFGIGHRIRLAVSSSYWPWVWPHPDIATLTVHSGRVRLPVRTGPDNTPAAFDEPESAPPLPVQSRLTQTRAERMVRHDVGTGTWEIEVDPNYGGTRTFPDGLVYEESGRDRYRIAEGDPLSARVESTWDIKMTRGDWSVHMQTRSTVSATREHFCIDNEIRCEADGEPITYNWSAEIPRTSA